MHATRMLSAEHRLIEQGLACLKVASEQAVERGALDLLVADKVLGFLREFADRFHHAKEEDLLFPLLERRGFSPELGPTAVMRQEHTVARERLRRMELLLPDAAATPAGARAFHEEACRYVDLLREHIHKEDHCLFSMADGYLNEQDQEELLQQLLKLDEEEPGSGIRRRNAGMVRELAATLGVGPLPAPSRG